MGGELARAVAGYYRDEWDAVAAGMRTCVGACLFDHEAKATFDEALAAHGAGLFRCAPRLLLPEIERVARVELHGGEMAGIANFKRLREAVGGLTPMQMDWSGIAGLRSCRKLTEHMYEHLRDSGAVGVAAVDPVPNRHAAVHGQIWSPVALARGIVASWGSI